MSRIMEKLLTKGARATDKTFYYTFALNLCGIGHKGATIKLGTESLQCYDTDPSHGPHVHHAKNGTHWQEVKGGEVLREGWITRQFRVTTLKRGQSGNFLGDAHNGKQTVIPYGGKALNRGQSIHPYEKFYREFRWGMMTARG